METDNPKEHNPSQQVDNKTGSKSTIDKSIDFLEKHPNFIKELEGLTELISNEIYKHTKLNVDVKKSEQKGKWRATMVGLGIVLTILLISLPLGYWGIIDGTSIAFIFGVSLGYIFAFIAQLHYPFVVYGEE